MAPEVLDGCYGPEADWWSLGVLLYVTLSGIPPFWVSSRHSLEDCIRHKAVSFRSVKWNGASDEAKDLLLRLLCKDPAQRICGAEILGKKRNATASWSSIFVVAQ